MLSAPVPLPVDELRKKINGFLNKLSPQNFDSVSGKLVAFIKDHVTVASVRGVSRLWHV